MVESAVSLNLQDVYRRIKESYKIFGIEAANFLDINIPISATKLIAVSKNQSDEKILEALSLGQRLFGENRVQEAYQHWEHLKPLYPDLELHLIGPLQTNKVAQAVALFDVIQVLDREKLARYLSEEMKKQNRFLPCLIQVNTGDERQKGGISVPLLREFLEYCKNECHLDVRGLMCIPPVEDSPSLHFALLRKLARIHGLNELSMGMSSDFENAVVLGATYVRLGTAIFGDRG